MQHAISPFTRNKKRFRVYSKYDIHTFIISFIFKTLPIFTLAMEIMVLQYNVTETCNKSWATPVRQPRVLMIIPNVGEFDMVSGTRVRRFDNLQTTIVDY